MAERPDPSGPEPIEPDGAYLGEFRRGPAIFTVFRIAVKPDRYRVMCSDGNGPGPVCVFADQPGSEPRWHGAWNGDEWCAWIEAEARKVIERLATRVRRRADRCRRSQPSQHLPLCRRTRPHVLARRPPGPRRGPAGRSIMVEIDRPASAPPAASAGRARSRPFAAGPG